MADQRTPPQWMRETCELEVGDLRDQQVADRAVRGGDPRGAPGRDRRRDRELPQAPAHAARGEHRALQLGLPRRAHRGRRAARVRLVVDGLRARHGVPDSRGARRTRLPAPRSAYGFSKLAGEVYCRALADEHGLRYSIVRPFNAYGPGEMPEDEPGIAHAVPDLIRKVLSGQRPLQIFGSGEQTRTLTYVDDIAEGIVAAMAHPAAEGEDFNISASEEMTVARDRASDLAGVRRGPGRARVRAPADLRGGRAAPLAVGREGTPAARMGGRRARRGGTDPDRRVDSRVGARAE